MKHSSKKNFELSVSNKARLGIFKIPSLALLCAIRVSNPGATEVSQGLFRLSRCRAVG